MGDHKVFDPEWRDDVYCEEAFNIPLLLPRPRKTNDRVWAWKRAHKSEEIFGRNKKYDRPRVITAIVKKTHGRPSMKLTDDKGNDVSEDNPIWDIVNPPKAWMSDSAEELMSMFSAAKEARGDVLVGGLGMGIYPQMALYLKRPVDSFTIIDNSHDVIEITTDAWLDHLDDDVRSKIDIIEQSFEEYIKTTEKKFDTIYVDLWEDSDPRLLPYYNHLVDYLKPLCKEGGRIYIWAYALAIDSFVKLIHSYETNDIDIQKIPVPIDPLLSEYAQWRGLKENENLSIKKYEKKARELALTFKLKDLAYDKDQYFFPHSVSLYERQIIAQILHLAERDKPKD
ncbi:MAG: hypothetical protein MUF15_06960 [Acidobacteria bacterium]|jgi:hypothetical protein|nr:hypothetical protein [Acidobacteriota bacterium]